MNKFNEPLKLNNSMEFGIYLDRDGEIEIDIDLEDRFYTNEYIGRSKSIELINHLIKVFEIDINELRKES